MKTTLKAVAALIVVLFLFTRCNEARKEKESAVTTPMEKDGSPSPPPPAQSEQKAQAESGGNPGTPQSLKSSAAVEDGKDSIHQFIRTADIKCKVKDVASTTYQVEDITRRMGGYVTYTNLASTVDNTTEIPVSADSSLQTVHYNVQNTITIRVPNTNLDSELIALTPLVDYLDFGTIKANDAALQILTNKLRQMRLARHEERMKNAIDARGKKLLETTDAEDDLLNKQEQADNAKIGNMALTDEVKYSTINLSLYQPDVVTKNLAYNEKSVKPYEPALSTQFIESVQFGWRWLAELLLFAVKLWPLLLGSFIAVAGLRLWKARVSELRKAQVPAA